MKISLPHPFSGWVDQRWVMAFPQTRQHMNHHKTHALSAFGFVLIALVATGCGGITASKSISPLDFLLPGLIENHTPLPVIPMQTNTVE